MSRDNWEINIIILQKLCLTNQKPPDILGTEKGGMRMGLERINQLKKEKRLTNARLAELSGVNLSTLDKITGRDA